MNIVIVGDFPFPTGAASSVRVRNMALGLQENGVSVRILSLAPATIFNPSGVKVRNLSFGDLNYELLDPILTGVSKSARIKARYCAIFKANQRIKHLFLQAQCDALIVYGRGISRILPLMWGLPSAIVKILDVVEYYQNSELFGSQLEYWDYQLGEHFIHRFFDGFTVITTTLQQLYEKRGFANILTFPHVEQWTNLKMPASTINLDRPFRLTYVGAMIVRDNPQQLYEIMRHLVEMGINIQLDVIGHFARSAYGREIAQKFERDALLAGRINLLGALSDDALVNHLQQSDGLILTRRNVDSEIYAFPTRLLEYLQQGRPVFVASVGDVPYYLEHGRDAILFDPEDALKAATTLAKAIQQPEWLHQIGLNGQKEGAQIFDRKQHAKNLLNFIAFIKKSKLQPLTLV